VNKKTIFILGGGLEQLEAIKMSKELNLSVIVSDKNKNAPGIIHSDKFYNLSIQDFKGNLAIAKKHKTNGVFTLCSEVAVPTVAKITSKLKLMGISIETAKLSTNKIKMKNRFKKKNIKTPEFASIKDHDEYKKFIKKNKFPFVLKPTDASGQKGIELINNSRDIKKKINIIKSFSSDKKVLIEKFYNGYELNVVALVENKKVKFLSISHRKTSIKKSFGIATEHIYPSKLNNTQLKELKKLCIKSIKSIGLINGVAYPQVILTDNDEFYLIEIASRIPGGYMREMALMASGIDPIEFMIHHCLGYKNSLARCKKHIKKKSIYIKFFTKLDFEKIKYIKRIKGLNNAKKTKGIYDIFFRKTKQIPKLNSSHDRFGAILAYGNNITQAINNVKKSINKIDFVKK
jgi:biotin carboxylase